MFFSVAILSCSYLLDRGLASFGLDLGLAYCSLGLGLGLAFNCRSFRLCGLVAGFPLYLKMKFQPFPRLSPTIYENFR